LTLCRRTDLRASQEGGRLPLLPRVLDEGQRLADPPGAPRRSSHWILTRDLREQRRRGHDVDEVIAWPNRTATATIDVNHRQLGRLRDVLKIGDDRGEHERYWSTGTGTPTRRSNL